MECEENGAVQTAVAGQRGLKRKRGGGGVQLARASALPRSAGRRTLQAQPPKVLTPPRTTPRSPIYRSPFLNVKLMEEITFWVCTRRAPCLYGYNNVYKKKIEEAHCSKYRNSSELSSVEDVPSPKKKKKLGMLDDESISSEKQQNVYFERSHKQYQSSWYSSHKSDINRSDIDFNINSALQNKSRALRNQRKNSSAPNKKSKLITSTPKTTTLRRSLRKTRRNYHSSQMDHSLVIFDSNVLNGEHPAPNTEYGNEKRKSNNHKDNLKEGTILKEKSKNEMIHNSHFEDLSDVSGFTANYIRSTKVNSKTLQKVRCKPSRNLVRESQQKLHKDESKIIVCVNKSVNTGLPAPVFNQSTDSSQNVINLVTVNNNNNEKSLKIDQSTSQLKFMDTKNNLNKESDKEDIQNTNRSFQSKSSIVSRYPIRHRNNTKIKAQDLENSHENTTLEKKRTSRGMRELKSINQNKEPICSVSRTRSGKQIGVVQMDLDDSGCSKVQVNNIVDKVSSSAIKNVASSADNCIDKKKRLMSTRCSSRTKKSDGRKQGLQVDSEDDSMKKNVEDSDRSFSPMKCDGTQTAGKRRSLRKESLRDKSGFAACFSDSEEDKPLLRRKFFC